MTDAPVLRIEPPPAFLADPALAAVMAALPEARVVGGAVRDAVAGREITDVDLATPRTPEQITQALRAAGIRAVPTGLDHGTVTAVVDGRGFEITTLRRDIETDGRHARVVFTDDWRADAARRDFTINALSMTRDAAVFDYFDGVADLRAGRLRFVGDPSSRIAEDYLRILRYFRFFARYASGPVDPAALAAIRAGLPGLAMLSAERVWSELIGILSAPDPRGAISLMATLGVLRAVLPEGADPSPVDRLVAAGAPADPLLRLAAMLTGEPAEDSAGGPAGDPAGDPTALASRLRLSGAERDRLTALCRGPVPQPGDDDAALRRLLADEARPVLIDRSWLAGGGAPDWAALRARLAALPAPAFPLEGRDVLALGLAEGPRVGVLLRAVRQWWLHGGCIADADACRAELARQLRQS